MKIGIIGGSGLYHLEGDQPLETVRLTTPFGEPSDEFVRARLGAAETFFLPRHGRGHRLLPSEINHRANLFAFKALGVSRIFSVTAVGSLKEAYRPRDLVLPDQYFDRTRDGGRHTFFGNGIVAHVSLADPVCPQLHSLLSEVAQRVAETRPEFSGTRVHRGGTYVNMEGPAFSTRAESRFYQACGFDVIGMTSLPEARLAREAGICYAPLAMVTDYDCWHAADQPVTAELVVANVRANVALAREILVEAIRQLPESCACPCAKSLVGAIMSDPAHLSAAVRRQLRPLLGELLD